MNLSFLKTISGLSFLILGLILFFPQSLNAQQGTGALRGQVSDEFGGIIVGATVTVTDTATGTQKTATTNDQGLYTLAGLAPGKYTVSVAATGFSNYENTSVDVAPGRREPLDIKLSVALAKEEVTVAAETPVSTAPENNAGAVVLRGADLAALPEDPDDLASALQALAGPSAGPNGGQIYIDGFTGGRLPPRESIREVRINQNPFAAEYDRPGFGRIEILTKPGTDRFRGQAFFNFQDESLNSRNPFTINRAPFQRRIFGGNVSGPISRKKASFFLDFEKRDIDDNANINATILDSSLNITSFSEAVLTPRRRTTFSPRLDYQINNSNTLVARYSYEKGTVEDAGLDVLTLPSRAYNTNNTEQTLQLTETAILNAKTINETRFQFVRDRNGQNGGSPALSINVLDAFVGGGAQVGNSFNNQNRWELQNYTTHSLGQHAIKFGARVRGVHIDNTSVNNFNGTYTFAGGLAVPLDANNQAIPGAALVQISSIERYRRTLLFQKQGLSATQIRALGGGASQFSIAAGNPEAKVSQMDFGGFVQDDWRLRPDLTLSAGLRYETQNNISSNLNFAPRLGIAWSPGAKSGGSGRGGAGGGFPGLSQQPLVIRAGFGVFYDRFGENLTLQALRFNGTNQQQYVVSSSTPSAQSVLDLYPNVPPIATLASFALPQTTRIVAPDLQAPYTMQGVLSVEKLLPRGFTVFSTYIASRSLHTLRIRNINAPLPGTFTPGLPGTVGSGGVRPNPAEGDVLQFESSGRVNQNQLILGTRSRLNKNVSFFVNYVLSKSNGDTDGGFGPFGGGGLAAPSNPYDLSQDYGRTRFDIRHRLFMFGSFTMPWKVQLNPFVIVNSRQPYNIFIGRDLNGDTFFTERPAFASDPNKPGVVQTPYGALDPNPTAGEQIIPRNFGNGPAFFNVNLNVSKTFGFGEVRGNNAAQGGGGGGGGRGGRGGGPGGPFGGGGGGMFGGPPTTEKRYNLTLSVRFNNLLNHTNAAVPNGNISSLNFGRSIASAGGFGPGGDTSAGNRRVELQLRFSF